MSARCNKDGAVFFTPPEPDWGQRRYEIARDICNGVVAKVGLNAIDKEVPISVFAVAFADALIKELQKDNQYFSNEL